MSGGLRFGVVVGLDEKTCKVRVQFQDLDRMVSDWLPVVQQKTLRDKCYWLPDLDEHVVVLMDANLEAGAVLGAIYSGKDAPPAADKDLKLVRFSDGTQASYNRKTHKLEVKVEGELVFQTTKNMTFNAGQQINMTGQQFSWNGG